MALDSHGQAGRVIVEAMVFDTVGTSCRVAGPSFDAFIVEEKARALEYGGRMVFDRKLT